MGKIFDRATNPKQYDFEDMLWGSETEKSPFRIFYLSYLSRYSHLWGNAKILDIGCGLGWLLNLLKKNGAKEVEGLDPSEKNINFAKKEFPEIIFYNDSLEDFETTKKYDLIISVMVFSHIKNLKKAFDRVNNLLEKDGELQIIVPDLAYFRTPRFDYKIESEKISEEEYAIQIPRTVGVIADIVREVSLYEKFALESGFKLIEDVPLAPTEDLIGSVPQYKRFKGQPISHLLRFKKILNED